MSKPETSKTQTSEPKKNAELAKDFNAAFKNFDKDGSGNDSRFSNSLGLKITNISFFVSITEKII
jgi:hypothetical protein